MAERSRPLRAVFVAGTGTDVGKTVVTAGLLRALRGLGVAAQAVKPVQTGVPPGDMAPGAPPAGDAAVYGAAVADLPGTALSRGAVLRTFALPASPFLAASEEGASLDADGLARDISEHWARVSPGAELLLLEAAGGLLAPLNARESMLDLMARLDAPVVLVVRNELGALNHALLSLGALQERGLALAGLAVVEPPRELRETCGARILEDNIRFLRARLAQDWPDAALCPVPWAELSAPRGWERIARALLPLARALCAAPAQPEAAKTGDMESRDHAALWHPTPRPRACRRWKPPP